MRHELAVPAGQGDPGHADPELAGVVAAGDLDRLPAAFARARLFVAVEPRLLESDRETGADKVSEMVLVTLRRPDGATAVPAFSSVAALAAWRASARPVPVPGSALAAEACRLGHGTVVLDVGGDSQVSLSVEALSVEAPPAEAALAEAAPVEAAPVEAAAAPRASGVGNAGRSRSRGLFRRGAGARRSGRNDTEAGNGHDAQPGT